VPKRFWNLGIRIEDDVMVTAQGCEVLTEAVPSDPKAIEAAMARRAA
jgi:Xaa-Pro aminopeptidase